MLYRLQNVAWPDRPCGSGSVDMSSIVDRLLAVAEQPASDNQVDRAMAQHRQLTLARTIKNLIERDEGDCKAA